MITGVWKHKGARGNQAKIRITSNVSATTYVVAQSVVGATDGTRPRRSMRSRPRTMTSS